MNENLNSSSIDLWIEGWDRRLPIVLTHHGAPRISPVVPDIIEVECTFEQFSMALNPMGSERRCWVPLSEAINMPRGHVVHRGSMNIARPSLNRFKVQGFLARHSTEGIKSSYSLAGRMPNGGMAVGQSLRGVEFWVDDGGAKTIAIAKDEYTRFTLAGFGSFIEHLIGIDVDPNEIFAKYCDLGRTGLDGSVFRIAPRPEHASRLTVFQLAMLMCDADCLQALRGFGRALRLAIIADDTRLPNVSPPESGINLNLGIERRFRGALADGFLKGFPDAQVTTRILGDRRKMKFSRIVVELPEIYTAEGRPKDEDDKSQDHGSSRNVLGRGTKVDRQTRPGRGARPFAFSTGSLWSHYPRLANVEYSEQAEVEISVPRSSRKNPIPTAEVDQVSTLPPIGNGGLRQLVHTKTVPLGTRKPLLEPREIQPCFLDQHVPPARSVIIEFDSLDERLGSFSEAANILDGWNSLDFALSSAPRSRPAVVHAFEWSREHGNWCWSQKLGRSRRILVHTVLLEDATILVAEIERLKRGDTYSIGLIWSFSPVRTRGQIARIVGQLGVRNSSLHDPGTWSPHTFEDMRFATLYHSPARNLPYKLAQDIMDRAHELRGSISGR